MTRFSARPDFPYLLSYVLVKIVRSIQVSQIHLHVIERRGARDASACARSPHLAVPWGHLQPAHFLTPSVCAGPAGGRRPRSSRTKPRDREQRHCSRKI